MAKLDDSQLRSQVLTVASPLKSSAVSPGRAWEFPTFKLSAKCHFTGRVFVQECDDPCGPVDSLSLKPR